MESELGFLFISLGSTVFVRFILRLRLSLRLKLIATTRFSNPKFVPFLGARWPCPISLNISLIVTTNGGCPMVGSCSRSKMLMCNYRVPRNRPGECWLRTTDVVPNSDYWGALVFKGNNGEIHALCDDQMIEVCPYRVHTVIPKPIPKSYIPCSACGEGHRSKTSLMICQTRHIVHTQYNQPWTPEGTTENLYPIDPPEWSKHYSTTFRAWAWPMLAGWIINRDKNICQDCGVHSETVIGKDKWGSNLTPTMEVHHIIPRSRGGGDHPKNLKTLCQRCHAKYTGELHSEKKAERLGVGKSLEEFA